MKITTAWTDNGDGDGCTLVSAYAETDFDNWGGVPEWHTDLVKKNSQEEPVRELVIEIPDEAVTALFHPPAIRGEVTA